MNKLIYTTKNDYETRTKETNEIKEFINKNFTIVEIPKISTHLLVYDDYHLAGYSAIHKRNCVIDENQYISANSKKNAFFPREGL